MKKYIPTLFYIFSYGLITTLSFSSFELFRPFSYVDNDHSYIKCLNDGISYETSPNLIFAIDTQLDSFNDAKAKKLCEYKIINDYIGSFATPKETNYEFLPALSHKSSLPNGLFVFSLTFIAGSLLVEGLGKLLGFKSSFFGKKLFHIFINFF